MTLAGVARRVTAIELGVIVAIASALLFPTPGVSAAHRYTHRLGVAPASTGRFVPSTPLNVALVLLWASANVDLFAAFDLRYSLSKVSSLLPGVVLFWISPVVDDD